MAKGLLVAALVAFAVLGAVVGLAIIRGWRRRGYFSVPATILIALAVFIAFQAVGSIIIGILYATGHKQGLSILVVNGVAQLAVMLIGTVLLSRALGQDPFAVFRLQGFGETKATTYLLAVPIILSAQFVGEALSALWVQILSYMPFFDQLNSYEKLADESMEGLVTATGIGEFVVILLMVAVIPAFAEETLFRGFTQSNIERSGSRGPRPMVALVITSLLFAAYHMSAFKFPGLLVLGAALGWMAYRTNNLFVGSLGHAINNGLIVTALFLAPDTILKSAQKKLVDSGDMSTSEALIALAVWLPALVLSGMWFARNTATMTARYAAFDEYDDLVHAEDNLNQSEYTHGGRNDRDDQVGTE